jgi:small nuclear ribonucleoprotein (snRNP)-like protein
MEKESEIDIYKVSTPIDLIKQSIGKEIYIKCKFNRELKGKLHVNYFL